jgi:hypothetical protein
MKRSLILISVGLLNFLHGMFHIIQFFQSILLVAYSLEKDNNHDEGLISRILHHPLFALLWAVVGIFTLIIGIKDYRHHKECGDKEGHIH